MITKERIEKINRTITLTLTEQCNLSCTYCYENHKSPEKMSLECAKTILINELNRTNKGDFNDVEIDFFGGEPFLEFELLVEIYNFLLNNHWNTDWLCFTTTNGTLVHGNIQKWLEKQKDNFRCGLSLDGTKEMHDLNRSNSFDKIDIEFFRKTYPKQPVKMTISPQTLPNLADGVIYLHNLGFNVTSNIAQGVDWTNKQNSVILEMQFKKLIEFYLEHPDIEPCTMLNMGVENVIDVNDKIVRKWCGAGTHMFTYDVRGNVYPCQFFMPLSIGNEKANLSKRIDFYDDISFINIDKKCQECVIYNYCPTCYGVNFYTSGNIFSKTEDYCKLMKIQFLATSYFKYNQIKRNKLVLTKEKEYRILKGIELVQQSL